MADHLYENKYSAETIEIISNFTNILKKKYMKLNSYSNEKFPPNSKIPLSLMSDLLTIQCEKAFVNNEIKVNLINRINDFSKEVLVFYKPNNPEIQKTTLQNVINEFIIQYLEQIQTERRKLINFFQNLLKIKEKKSLKIWELFKEANFTNECYLYLEKNEISSKKNADEEDNAILRMLNTKEKFKPNEKINKLALQSQPMHIETISSPKNKNNKKIKKKNYTFISNNYPYCYKTKIVLDKFNLKVNLQENKINLNDNIDLKTVTIQEGKETLNNNFFKKKKEEIEKKNIEEMKSTTKSFFETTYKEKESELSRMEKLGNFMNPIIAKKAEEEKHEQFSELKIDDNLNLSQFLMHQKNIMNKNYSPSKLNQSDLKETINESYYKPDAINLGKYQAQSNRFLSYEMYLPQDYYNSLPNKDSGKEENLQWYLRAHHIETVTEHPLSLKDNILDSKYLSYLEPLEKQLKPEEFIKEQKKANQQELIENLEGQISKLKKKNFLVNLIF